MQVSTIEFWSLIFNASIKLDGAVINYAAADDYGVIILSGVDEAPTLEEMLTNLPIIIPFTTRGGGNTTPPTNPD